MDHLELRHRLLTRLTAIKLSLQWLQRHPDRCGDKDGALNNALAATDDAAASIRGDRKAPSA